MKDEVEKKHPEGLEQFKKAIQESWNSLSQGIIDKCINHLEAEMEKILENSGEFAN